MNPFIFGSITLFGSSRASFKRDFWDGVFSIFGQSLANETNAAIASDNNRTMIELANTAHQREVKDLVAAGLNPVLSVDGAGAPVPALTSARVENTMGKGFNTMNTLNSALDASIKREQVDNLEAQTKNLDIQNEKLRAEIASVNAETAKKVSETRYPGSTGNLLRSAGNAAIQPFRWAKQLGDEIEKRTDTGHWRFSDIWPFNRSSSGSNSARSISK